MVQIKDGVVDWFMQNILMPQSEIIDKPGFVINKVGKDTFLRDLILPEELFVDIENKVSEKFGNKGVKALYSAGKKFGYAYTGLSNLPKLPIAKENQVEDAAYLLDRYIGGLYAEAISHKTDFKNKKVDYYLKNYAIHRKNKKGYIMTLGAIAGVYAYFLDSPGLDPSLQEGPPENFHLVCDSYAKKESLFIENKLFLIPLTNDFRSINGIRTAQFSKISLRTMIDTKQVTYLHGGRVEYNYNEYKEGLFFCDALILYLIESEMAKINGESYLFSICFDYGKRLLEKSKPKNSIQFIRDYFSAFGWGDVNISVTKAEVSVVCNYCPYYSPKFFEKKPNFVIFSGLISGLLSYATKKKVELKEVKSVIYDDYFQLQLKG